MSGKILNPRVSNFPRPESKFNSRGDRTKIRPPASPALFPVFDTAAIRSVPTSRANFATTSGRPSFRPSRDRKWRESGKREEEGSAQFVHHFSSFATRFDSFMIYRFASKSFRPSRELGKREREESAEFVHRLHPLRSYGDSLILLRYIAL